MYKIIPPLQHDMHGKDVANLQSALILLLEIKYLRMPPTQKGYGELRRLLVEEYDHAIYGAATYSFVELFQKQCSLLQTRESREDSGMVNEKTAQHLNDILTNLRAFEQSKPEEPVTKEDSEVLKPGMQNDAVKQLQDQLQKIGFTISDVTGYFGRSTRHAVVEFQLQNYLLVTGTVTLATLSAITKALMQREEEFKAKEPLSLSKEDLLYLEKNAGISPLDLKISDPDTFAQVEKIATAELGIFLAENFKDHHEKIRSEIAKVNLPALIDMQMDIQSALLELVDHLSAVEISAEEVAEFKADIQKLEKADIPQNPLATDLPLELHPMFKKFILIARFYQMCDSIGITDKAAKEVIEWMRRYCSGLK